MPNLDIMINGDCASAVAALSATERAIGGVQSRAGSGVTAAVSVAGARTAVKDLNAVSTAIGGATAAAAGFRSGGPIAGGLGAGAVAARGLTSSLGSTTRAMSEARVGAGALATAVGRIGAGAARGGALAGVLPTGGSASIMAAAAAMSRFQSALAAQQLQAARGLPVMAMANAETRALAGNATAAASAMTRLGGAPNIPGRWGANGERVGSGAVISDARSGPGTVVPGRWGRNGERVGSSAFTPPPIIPAGGGGGGGDGDDAGRRAAAAGKAGGELGKEFGSMLMASLAVGIAADAAVTKAATTAVNKTISETPALAKAAKDASDEFGKGVLDVSSDISASAIPAFERLATAQRAYGQETAKIGMANLNTFVEGQAATTDAQTRALISFEPAANAAIRASDNLAIAMTEGIGNPNVAQGVRSLSETLARPEVRQGIAEITAGVTGAGVVYAKFVADIGAGTSKILNNLTGAENAMDMAPTLAGAAQIGGLGFLRGGVKGGIAGAILGGSSVYGSEQLQKEGRDDLVTPSMLNEILGSGVGYRLGGMINPKLAIPAMLAGGLGAQYGTRAAANLPGGWGQAAPTMLTGLQAGLLAGSAFGPVGAAVGGAVGATAGVAASPAPAEDKGKMMFGGMFGITDALTGTPDAVSGAAGRNMEQLIPATASAPQGPVVPGPKKDAATTRQEKAAVSQERSKARLQESTRQRERNAGTGYGGTGQVGSGPPVSLPQIDAAGATAAASATQQLNQNAQQATQSVQSLGQSAPQAAQQVQALPAAFVPMQQLPAQASAQMKTASSIIQNSAQQVGSSIPPSISTGIVKQTPKVCDSAADMGASMVNCTARALQSASPSKKFIALGESTGDGAAIGVENSAGGAIGATGDMVSGMLGQVGALGSGVTAASDGAVPMAQAGGLMVGYVWARSVQTGVDSVLRTADFASASMPAINSALAKTTLGKLGLLGVAGSGASISKTAGGGIVTMGAPTPVVNATFQVSVDGTPLQVISQRQIEGAMDALADSFSRQRG